VRADCNNDVVSGFSYHVVIEHQLEKEATSEDNNNEPNRDGNTASRGVALNSIPPTSFFLQIADAWTKQEIISNRTELQPKNTRKTRCKENKIPRRTVETVSPISPPNLPKFVLLLLPFLLLLLLSVPSAFPPSLTPLFFFFFFHKSRFTRLHKTYK
jgi:hypothetical protein